MNRAIPSIALPLVLAAAAFAQSRNSFYDLQSMTGVNAQTSDGLTFIVSLDPGASVTLMNGHTYNVTDIMDFYALIDVGDIVATGTSPQGPGNAWGWHLNNADGGGIAGWQDANAATNLIGPGESSTFVFTTLDAYDRVGYHLHFDTTDFEGTGANTAYVTLVPEPASMAALAIGGLGLLARRRRRK